MSVAFFLGSSTRPALRVQATSSSSSSTRSARRPFSVSPAKSRQRLVVLGSGWGGYTLMKKIDKNRYDVTLVSPNTYFAFTPLLASTAVGTLEFRCAVEQNRRFAPLAHAFQAWCDRIDFDKRTLTCMPATPSIPASIVSGDAEAKRKDSQPLSEEELRATPPHLQKHPFELHYDKLVISVGAYAQTFGIPGVKEHALFLKDIRDARRIRTRIIDCFEQAAQPVLSDNERKRLLHFVLVGGGPTGVELAAEIHDLVASDIRRLYPELAKLTRITLYESQSGILQSFDKNLSAYAMKRFAREGVEIRPNTTVLGVGDGFIELKDVGRVPTGMVVWSTGLAPNPLVSALEGVKKDDRTKSLQVNEYLQVIMADGNPSENVWAMGDAAVVQREAAYPATAQVAAQEAKYLAKSLNRLAKEKEVTEPFVWRNLGQMSYVGGHGAVVDRSQAEGPKTSAEGRIAWLVWRSAYFSMTLSWRNKAAVAFFWTINLIFGRDVARF